MWRSRWRSARRSRIWAWTVTSSPVVGSSAMTSRGAQARAMAIITRWRMPPDSWKGYHRIRSSGEGMPTDRSSSMAVALASERSMPRWRRSDSVIWLPMRLTGLRAVIGSWKIMLSSAPHTWRRSFWDMAVRSWPAKWTVPLLITSLGGQQPHDRARQHGLARSRLAHHPEGLARGPPTARPRRRPAPCPGRSGRPCAGPRPPGAAHRARRRRGTRASCARA